MSIERKEQTINADVFHFETRRAGDGKVSIEHYGASPRNKERVVKFRATFDFGYLPYLIEGLRETWKTERAQRIREIENIDDSLGCKGE
jgi:hypothetical protein